jgi:hypothetical protein
MRKSSLSCPLIKPYDSQTIRNWLTNEMLIGWWQPDEDKPDVIIDNHPAVLDYVLFAEGYATLKGYTLEGEPVHNWKGTTRIHKTRETPPDLLFHGRLLITPPSPDRTAFISASEREGKFLYRGFSRQANGILKDEFLNLPGAPFDTLVVEHLKALEKADLQMKDKVKATLEAVYSQQSEDFVSIHEQLRGIQAQLVENAKKRMRTSVDDPMYIMLEEEQSDLLERQNDLEAKKDRLGIVDSPDEIARLHSLLGNFEAVRPTFDLTQRQRTFSLLTNRIEIEVVSPHWLRLTIDWLDAVCPRLDVAYIWKVMPSHHRDFTDEEKAIMRQYYSSSTRLEILQRLPDRTWYSLRRLATEMGPNREFLANDDLLPAICYCDLIPGTDGRYLFRDYETTLGYIKEAILNTSRVETPLYALWILSENVEDLLAIVQSHLECSEQAEPEGVNWTKHRSSRTCWSKSA